MTTSLITGTITTGITLTSAAFSDPVTVASGGTVTTNGVAISAATTWTIDNYGRVYGDRQLGIMLSAGGAVTNAAGAIIYGYHGGIDIAGAAGTVSNSGLIEAYEAGVKLGHGGSVTNAAGGGITSTAYAAVYGAYGGGSISVTNAGRLYGVRFGVVFRNGGTVFNQATGKITSDADTGVYAAGRAAETIVNAGAISGYERGAYLGVLGGTLTNAAGGSIVGTKKDGVVASGAATVVNAGTITGGVDAVDFENAGGNRLIIGAGAVFNGTVTAASGANVIELSSSATKGVLSGLGSKYVGFGTITIDSGAAWTVAGAEAGFAGVAIGGFDGADKIDLTDVAYVAGETATIGASDVLTVSEAGAVLATVQLSASQGGLALGVSSDGAFGIRIAELTSRITGTYSNGVTLTSGAFTSPVTVASTASITSSLGDGISAATSWTIDNDGTVKSRGFGIGLQQGGAVTNAAGASISGGAFGVALLGPGTVQNAGTITGGIDAVSFGGVGSDRLIIDPGAVFNGNVAGNAGFANVIELASGASAGALNGLGSNYIFFPTVSIDSRASWAIAGGHGGFAGVTIRGFTQSDRLDLTDIAYATGETATVNSASLLTVDNSDGTTLATVQLYGILVGSTFTVASDGGRGILVTEGRRIIPALTGTYGIGVTLTSAGYTNPVTVTATGKVDPTGASSVGLTAGTPWTVYNFGSISAHDGVALAGGSMITNAAGGVIDGTALGVSLGGGGVTLENAGTISGGSYAVQFSGTGNRLVVDGGAVFAGEVAGAGSTTLELSAKSGPGRLSGLGSQFRGFTSIIEDSGATWTVSGAVQSGSVDVYGVLGGQLTVDDVAAVSVQAGGTVAGVMIGSGGTETVLSFGADSGATVAADGVLEIEGNGRSIDAVIQGGSALLSGTIGIATLTGATVESGIITVGSGGFDASATIANGGTVTVLSGGNTSLDIVSSGGQEVVSSGGSTNGIVVSSSGTEIVEAGGSAGATVVMNGGQETVSSGGTTFGITVVSSGGTLIQVLADVGAVTVFGGGREGQFGGTTNDVTLSGGNDTVVDGVASDVMVFSGGVALAANFFGSAGGTLDDVTVFSDGVAATGVDGLISGMTADSGATVLELAGTVETLTLNGGTQYVGGGLPGVPALKPPVPAVASGTTIASGGLQIVNPHGSAFGTVILSGGEAKATSGGTVAGAVVSSGGLLLQIQAEVSMVTVFGGGHEGQFGGTTSGVTLSGGNDTVVGGTASGITVSSGGLALAANFLGSPTGGTLDNVSLFSGGVAVTGVDGLISGMTAGSGATVLELAGEVESLVLAGATQFVGGSLPGLAEPNPAPLATASGTTVSSGGKQILNGNGSAIDTGVLSGGEIVFNGGQESGLSLASGAMIDVPSLVYASSITVSFAENSSSTGGTLTVSWSSGSHSVGLLGQYVAAGFHISSDGAGGTLITYGSASSPVAALAASPH